MGFDEGRIVLDSPNGAYYPGQTIHGKLIFQQDKEKNFRGIFVKFKGFCKVHWTTHQSYTDSRGKRQTRTINHDSYEEYANVKTYLVGGESGDHKIDPGHYEYPFTFVIPQNCPSSFEGGYGHIRYHVKVVVDRAFKFDQEKKAAIRVFNAVDLNRDPTCREPIEMEFDATYSCCCMGSGATYTVVNVPVSGFCSGQVIPIEVCCNNKGSVEVDDIKVSIVKKVTFIATVNPAQKSEKDTVAKITKGPIPPNTTRNYTVEMEIPALDVYDVDNCRYIDITYKLKVCVSPSGCHRDSDGSRRVVLGTIPLVGYQDNIQNPLHDQMPQQVAAVTQQPLPSYSGNPHYPAGNTPYPGSSPYPSNDPSKSPYPSRNSPYPSNDSKAPYPSEHVPLTDNPPPYPGSTISEKAPYPTTHTNSPYLTKSSPYPTENSPNPPGNPSFPAPTSPFPAPTSPYPAGNSPYPTGSSAPATNLPYPPENSPYPSGNMPYPTTNSPYPGSSPYPAGNPSMPGILKTGNIGFTIPGSTNLPTMPLGTNVPGVNPDPFATASAPPPLSPDTDKKE